MELTKAGALSQLFVMSVLLVLGMPLSSSVLFFLMMFVEALMGQKGAVVDHSNQEWELLVNFYCPCLNFLVF